tara:strand:- start:14434 stop:15084 length:651 start_codon:yes stop_codon:yes gene_type:complete
MHNNFKKGLFITFEGGEGSGKSTQSKILYEKILKENCSVIYTREPGGSDQAESIRNLLVTGDSNRWSPITELFLFSAARFDHVEKKIKPALEKNNIVICDRYIDSTTAYQGYAGSINKETINIIQDISTQNTIPDLTFILDIDPDIGLKRSMTESNYETRFENKDLKYHKKIREGYLSIAKENSQRCKILNANDDINNISNKIYTIFQEHLIKAKV